jgi:hypothetical protein
MVPHGTAVRQSHAAREPRMQPEGNAVHAQLSGSPPMSEVLCWQYWLPRWQKLAPHRKVPAGAVQPPRLATSWPAAAASHWFEWTRPSQAQTGMSTVSQACGRGRQVPWRSAFRQSSKVSSQYSFAAHCAPAMPPQTVPVPPLPA